MSSAVSPEGISDGLRAVMRLYPTGVTVVSTSHDGQRHGMTVNSFTSVSLTPPLVLVCIAHSSHCNPLIKRAGAFAVSVLAHDQDDVSSTFASTDPAAQAIHEFSEHEYSLGPTGSPLLKGAVAHLDCRVDDQFEVGDHTVFIGQVIHAAEPNRKQSLLFFQGKYGKA